MKKLKYLILSALLMAGTGPVFALTITVKQYPQVSAGTQAYVNAAVDDALVKINNDIQNIDSSPEKMATAMANSAVYSNHSSTQRGYQGYDLFALSVGSMIGFQAPSNDPEAYKNLESDLKRDGDINAGANLQAWSAQIGLNTSKFLVEDLYMALKFGILKYDMTAGEGNKLDFDYFTVGLLANYQIVKEASAGFGFFKWRGLSIGSGLLYQKNTTTYKMKLDQQSGSDNGVNLTIDPDLQFKIDSDIFTVPLELTTAVRLLWIVNLSLGAGADFSYGKSDMNINLDGTINVSSGATIATPGSFTSTAGVNDALPDYVKPKVMAGLGLCLGPVMIDVPVTYYFNNGFNVGVTAGFVW
jgi:hypothetical protein